MISSPPFYLSGIGKRKEKMKVKSKGVDHEERDSEQVSRMFDEISGSYDRLNRVISLGRDLEWRRMAAKATLDVCPKKILDVCSGTADMAIEIARTVGGNPIIDGVDFSPDALDRGSKKLKKTGLEKVVRLKVADAESLPFDDSSYDAVTIAFGLRNIKDRNRALFEFKRVLRTGGRFVCLEFSRPDNRTLRHLVMFYLRNVVPLIAWSFRADAGAYRYLAETVAAFPDAPDLCGMLKDAGFVNTRYKKLFLGSAVIHIADKP